MYIKEVSLFHGIINIDIDGILRPDVSAFDKILQIPYPHVVEQVNELYDAGYKIVFFTACPWQQYEVTLAWINQCGFKFHDLICGKPPCDYLVDDRSFKSINELLTYLNK